MAKGMAITIKRALHGLFWSELVDAVESCLGKMGLFSAEEWRTVIFDDACRNGLLRATVIRTQTCFTVAPWEGPWEAASGFGYARVFTDHRAEDIAQSIGEQLFAARCATRAVECFECGSTFDPRETRWLRFLSTAADDAAKGVPCEILEREESGAVPLCPVCGTARW